MNCEGKQVYSTFAKAVKIAKRQSERGFGKLEPYRCDDKFGCGLIHIGHKRNLNKSSHPKGKKT